ncbi:MAG: ribulose-phosphate 3-epimerase [bacterium]|nr:ribulose-phosphate 3-epimerase [bacterium]
MHDITVLPSILASDFSSLGREISRAGDAGATHIHVDVMDGAFVPPITIGADVVKALKKGTSLTFDVHLMICSPEKHISAFAEAGADMISLHVEATAHLHRALGMIRQTGAQAGVALNPATPLDTISYVLEETDYVLLMTVNPGYGGQSFIEAMLPKIAAARAMIDRSGRDIRLEVDGGVNVATAARVIEAGADMLVAGTAVFGADDMAAAMRGLRGEI